MSTHDSWVFLKTGSTFDELAPIFKQGMPMRDPFPMSVSEGDDGEPIALWMVDNDRLSPIQELNLVHSLAKKWQITPEQARVNVEQYGGFSIAHSRVERLVGGAECYQRTKELLDFMERVPKNNTALAADAWAEFITDQFRRWVYGNEVPAPLPQDFKDYDPRIQSAELEAALKVRWRMENTSTLDFIMGASIIDSLNELDPSNTWEFDR
ncbi:hypothetical protein [Microcoleus sp. FACHB-68]|uniref:hypothetical protein n=1 Tax=Microcoleus sp. FACHB-68 TaxID=2692826 RepID=UPI0016864F3A|nr:hypothetical protein [Microcoleus sp. FACHB-68]MBD1939100.1 hypothetical protein [Microcoleus sp. FACHB-68]